MHRVKANVLQIFTRSFSLSGHVGFPCWPQPDYGPMEVMRSELMNGIKVASSKPMGAQIGACTIMFQAGSRYEQDDQLGASHFLRALSSSSGCAYSGFIKTRYMQQNGGVLTCSSDRQSVAYTLRCPITCFSDLKSYLLDTAVRGCYNPWDIEDYRQLIRDDLTRRSSEQIAMDLIQKASFGGLLANSVFCQEERINGMSQDILSNFVKDNFKSVRCTVGSVGMSFEETLNMAEKIQINRERPADPCTPLSFPKGGYEYHDLGPGSDTIIALAVPSCSSCDISCLLKHNVIAAACGTGDVQTGQHNIDRTVQSPLGLMAGPDVFTDYRAFNISYFDLGLFGILAKTRASTASQVALCAAEFMANIGGLDFHQLNVGKHRLKLAMALNDGDCVKTAEGLALQIANGVQIDSARNAMSMIDAIPLEDLVATAKILARKCSCMSVAVVGDIGAVPEGREFLLGY